MKKLLLTLFSIAIVFITKAHADDSVPRVISCRNGNAINVTIDLRDFQSTNSEDYIFAASGHMAYNYSYARFVCSDSPLKDMECIGYWTGKEKAKVNFSLDSVGKLQATFITSNIYKNKRITALCDTKE